MRSIKALQVLTLCTLLLTGCAPGPLSEAEIQQALDNVKLPDALISYEREGAEGQDDEESDGYYQSFDTSSICNSVAELGQLTYQAGFGDRNKQALPPELRSFEIRNGIKILSYFTDDEYLVFYLTLLSFEDSESAEDFASPLKAAVQSCGDVAGDVESRTSIKYSELSGSNDFSHQAKGVFEIFSVSIQSTQFDYLVQRGALVALVHVTSSEGGLEYSGFSNQEIDDIAKDLIGQVLP